MILMCWLKSSFRASGFRVHLGGLHRACFCRKLAPVAGFRHRQFGVAGRLSRAKSMNHSRQALMSDPSGELQPLSPANATRLAIRVWTAARRDLRWTSDLSVIHLISDLILASEGTLGQGDGAVLTAYFPQPSQAFRSAKRIQWALLDFCQHRPQLCAGAALLIYEARDLPAESEGTSRRAIAAILEHSKAAQILTAAVAGEELKGLPGLQMRGFAAPHGDSEWRGVQELIWTTPSNLERAQEVFRSSAQNLVQEDVRAAASEATVGYAPSADRQLAQPTLVHVDQTPRQDESELGSLSGLTAPEPDLEDSGSGALWWSLAAVGVAAVLALVFLLPRLRPTATAVPESPPPVVQSTTPQEPDTPQTEIPSAQKPPVESSGPSAPPNPGDQQAKAESPSAQPPPHPPVAKRPTEIDGLTAKDIPLLLRIAQNDAGAGRYDKARSEFNIVLRLDPGNAEAKLGLRKLDLSEREAR